MKYASEDYINILPEIEGPAHCSCAIIAYEELGCETKKFFENDVRDE